MITKTHFTQKEKLWILEDDSSTTFMMEEILNIRYQLRFFPSFSAFDEELLKLQNTSPGTQYSEEWPDLVIVDLYLQDGFFLNYYNEDKRKKMPRFPFMVLSYADDLDILRTCFEQGALDFIVKPFRKGHLIVKIEQALKKNSNSSLENLSQLPSHIPIPHMIKDYPGHFPLSEDTLSILTEKELQILFLFLQSTHSSITREDILKHAWNRVNVHPSTINVHIHNLRRKIQSSGHFIKTEGNGKWTLLTESIRAD